MAIPIINTSATNIELSPERLSLITKKLAPLSRMVVDTHRINIDVSIREVEDGGQGAFYVSVRLDTGSGVYEAASIARYLSMALQETRDSLRRSLSRGSSVLFRTTATA